jgi:hypothetical protein
VHRKKGTFFSSLLENAIRRIVPHAVRGIFFP